MKTLILLCWAAVLLPTPGATQFLRPAVFAAAGQASTSTNNQARLAFTLGEVAIATLGNPGLSCGQGFHNGVKFPTTGTLTPEALGIRLYPNPVAETLYLEYDNPDAGEYHIATVRNLLGQTLAGPFRVDWLGVQAIPVNHLAGGVYLLSLAGSGGREAVFRFVKAH